MKNFMQQPRPVPAQVELPQAFPEIPAEIVERFGESARDWQRRLNEFWTRTNQAIQQAQDETARQMNGTVVYNVDSFLIYANGVPTPMFALDSTGVRLGSVLVVNTPERKVYIGEGVYADDNTPFYVDALGFFSLGSSLVWDPDSDTLDITGTINADSGTIGGFTIGPTTLTGASVVLDSTGMIGAGTITPHAPFDAFKAVTNTHLTFGTLTTVTNGHTYLNIDYDNVNNCATWDPFTHNVDFRNICLVGQNSTGLSDGRVGIGKLVPVNLLHLYSSTQDSIITLEPSNQGSQARGILMMTSGALSSTNVQWFHGVKNAYREVMTWYANNSSTNICARWQSTGRLMIGALGTPSAVLPAAENTAENYLHVYFTNTNVAPGGGSGPTGITIEQTSTGDAALSFLVPSQRWNAGIDNSDGDSFKIQADNAGGFSGTGIRISTTGDLTVAGNTSIGTNGTNDFLSLRGQAAGSGALLLSLIAAANDYAPINIIGHPLTLSARTTAGNSTVIAAVSSTGLAVTGALSVSGLAGVGTRNVVADASGNLSAP